MKTAQNSPRKIIFAGPTVCYVFVISKSSNVLQRLLKTLASRTNFVSYVCFKRGFQTEHLPRSRIILHHH